MTVPGVVELRQYTLHPGARHRLMGLFDRAFVDAQEALGMEILGQFEDLDEPDRFVWLRGFPDFASRPEALSAFYYGPVWRRHRDEANTTMIDSDDVLLLRPARPASGLTIEPRSGVSAGGTVSLWILYPETGGTEEVAAALADECSGRDLGLLLLLETEPAANNFPALPVREGEEAVVAVVEGDRAAPDLQRDGLVFRKPAETRRLRPSARSRLRAAHDT
jgi:NIPSNAP protein